MRVELRPFRDGESIESLPIIGAADLEIEIACEPADVEPVTLTLKGMVEF